MQKEKKFTQAVLFSVWSICKEVERDRHNIHGSIELADQWASNQDDFGFLSEGRNEKIYGKTPKGSPITDSAYKIFNDRVAGSISKEGVTDRILPLLKKAKKAQLTDNLSGAISKYLKASEYYDLREVRDIINTILMSEDTDI